MDNTETVRGRPRAFDQDRALDRVVDAFHRHGVRNTTYDVLEQSTGLRRQSLVYAYGDKRALLAQALRRYADARISAVVDSLENGSSPAAGIRAAFDLWLEDAGDPSHPGCLLVNTAGEIGPSDDDLARLIETATTRLMAAFETAFGRARAAGELGTDIEPAALAALAVTLGDGALLHARIAGSAVRAKTSFDAFLEATFKDDDKGRNR